ncbi:hypothetical protein GWK47_025600 [Chionoecetes opilio]|uniref:Uncharacterized protein n=1 Tax=Chionoecetes opilio TaxID=41210 RepID=A0A8J8WF55_CHIOP|nr:hypothetical protein GWK47_025600 [Chionoecetes opilio]
MTSENKKKTGRKCMDGGDFKGDPQEILTRTLPLPKGDVKEGGQGFPYGVREKTEGNTHGGKLTVTAKKGRVGRARNHSRARERKRQRHCQVMKGQKPQAKAVAAAAVRVDDVITGSWIPNPEENTQTVASFPGRILIHFNWIERSCRCGKQRQFSSSHQVLGRTLGDGGLEEHGPIEHELGGERSAEKTGTGETQEIPRVGPIGRENPLWRRRTARRPPHRGR